MAVSSMYMKSHSCPITSEFDGF